MDINSVEFYTLAFVVAMALVALLMGRNEKKPPSTHIVQLVTAPAEAESEEDSLTMEPVDGGKVKISRTGFSLGPDETVNLVITVQDEKCTIVEKKGVKRRGSVLEPMTGEALLKCLRYGTKYRVRYESQLTSSWASFTFDTTSRQTKRVTLNY